MKCILPFPVGNLAALEGRVLDGIGLCGREEAGDDQRRDGEPHAYETHDEDRADIPEEDHGCAASPKLWLIKAWRPIAPVLIPLAANEVRNRDGG